MKRCRGCQVEKPFADFYKASGSGGYRSHCKACLADKQRAYAATEAGRASQRRGSRKYEASAKGKQHRREYEASPAGKAKARRYMATTKGFERRRRSEAQQWRDHPERKLARRAVARAVVATAGIFREDICGRCNRVGKTEAHHHRGYAPEFWLDVVWLCPPCHREADRELAAA